VGRKKLVRKAEPPSKRGTAWPRWTGFRGMTVRDWLQLLIVPLALVVIGFLFTMQQDQRQQQIENQRAEAERELAEQRAQDETLQAYLDQMGALLLEKDLRASDEDSEVRTLARARTLTVLRRLDPSRKSEVIQFLLEADLIQSVEDRDPVIALAGADLHDTTLGGARGQYPADLSGADLDHADLHNAIVPNAALGDADLRSADLRGASLVSSNLQGANLRYAKMGDVDLRLANLRGANLRDASLRDATLYKADGVVKEQIQEAYSLEGATMPNGQKYEDWRKDR
jgi:uncharacterized protein YjbI with pentapeptide repeats